MNNRQVRENGLVYVQCQTCGEIPIQDGICPHGCDGTPRTLAERLESIPTSLWSVGDAAPTRATSLEVDDEGVTFRTVEEVADYLIGAAPSGVEEIRDYVSRRRAVRDAKRAES